MYYFEKSLVLQGFLVKKEWKGKVGLSALGQAAPTTGIWDITVEAHTHSYRHLGVTLQHTEGREACDHKLHTLDR